jgi:hypothetical protein
MAFRVGLFVLACSALGCRQLEPWQFLFTETATPRELPVPIAEAPRRIVPPAAMTPKAPVIELVENQTPAPKLDAAALRDRFAQTYAQMTSYSMRFRRREMLGDDKAREELILCKFRQNPPSVYMKWIGEEAKGREVIYVKGRYNNEINTLLAAGDVPFMAGKRFAVAPDSILVKQQSRYPITEAGLGSLHIRYARCVADGQAQVLGKVKREEFKEPLDAVLQTLPPQSDPMFPKGARRTWYFDPASSLPVLITTTDERGREIEYYLHDRVQYPLKLDDDDFDPDKLWGKR